MTMFKHAPHHVCYPAEFTRSVSNRTGVCMKVRRKMGPSRPAFQALVIGTHADRSAVYDFPLVIHSNHGQSHTHSEITDDFG